MEGQKRFSIVIPVYNAENYLSESVESVLKQTIGFEKNVELILVNDGSKDGSAEICESYQQQYPDNVVYIYQDNAGPSAARNRGVEAATGEFIGFLDADDKFSLKTLSQVAQYFRIAMDLVDVAIIPVTSFGARNFPYYLNGKFDYGMRTIDLNEPNWNSVCMRVGQAFVRSEAAKSHLFDASITYFEDSKYINDIVSKKMRMGLVTGCTYYYRRYPAEADAATSLTVGAETNKRLYLETPVKVPLHFLEKYENDQDAPLYFQYLALCEMRWRTFYTQNRTADFLEPEEFAEYEAINDRILKRVSDHAIMTFAQYAPWQKLYLLNMKHKKNILEECTFDDENNLCWNDEILTKPGNAKALLLSAKIGEKTVELKGYIHALLKKEIPCFCRINGVRAEMEVCTETVSASEFLLDYEPYGYRVFSIKVPLEEETTTVSFGLEIQGQEMEIKSVSVSKRGDIDNIAKYTNFSDGYIIKREANAVRFVKGSLTNRIRYSGKVYVGKGRKYLKKVKSAIKKGPRFVLRKVKNKLFK